MLSVLRMHWRDTVRSTSPSDLLVSRSNVSSVIPDQTDVTGWRTVLSQIPNPVQTPFRRFHVLCIQVDEVQEPDQAGLPGADAPCLPHRTSLRNSLVRLRG